MNGLLRQFGVRAASAALTLVLIVGACSPHRAGPRGTPVPSSPVPTPTSHPTTITPAPTPTSRPTATTTANTPTAPSTATAIIPKAEIVDNLWEWTVIAGPSEYIAPNADFDGEVLIWGKTWSWPEGETQVVRMGDEVRDLHRAPPQWRINDAQVDEGRVVLVEFEAERGDYHLWVYDLKSGERTLLEEWGGEPHRHQVPLIALDGHRLAWSTTRDEGRSCIRIRNLETGHQFDAVCSPDTSTVLDWPYLRWPVLTYQLEELASDPSCRTIYTLHLLDGEPQPHEVTECHGFQGAADETVLAWTELRSGTPYPWKVPIYGEGPDGRIVKLGVASAGSVAVCEGRAYWETECSNCPDEIRSWVPGGPVEVIYRSPDVEGVSSYATTLPLCHGPLVVIQRAGGLHSAPGSPDEILVAWLPEGGGE